VCSPDHRAKRKYSAYISIASICSVGLETNRICVRIRRRTAVCGGMTVRHGGSSGKYKNRRNGTNYNSCTTCFARSFSPSESLRPTVSGSSSYVCQFYEYNIPLLFPWKSRFTSLRAGYIRHFLKFSLLYNQMYIFCPICIGRGRRIRAVRLCRTRERHFTRNCSRFWGTSARKSTGLPESHLQFDLVHHPEKKIR